MLALVPRMKPLVPSTLTVLPKGTLVKDPAIPPVAVMTVMTSEGCGT